MRTLCPAYKRHLMYGTRNASPVRVFYGGVQLYNILGVPTRTQPFRSLLIWRGFTDLFTTDTFVEPCGVHEHQPGCMPVWLFHLRVQPGNVLLVGLWVGETSSLANALFTLRWLHFFLCVWKYWDKFKATSLHVNSQWKKEMRVPRM